MTDYTRLHKQLTGTTDGDPQVAHRTGLVDKVNLDGTLDVTVGGVTLPGVHQVQVGVGVGDPVQLVVWRGGLLALSADCDCGGGGGGAVVPQWMTDLAVRPDGTPHADDDEFDDGTIDPAWVQVTASGTATWAEGAGLLGVHMTGQSASSLAAILRPITSPGAPMTIETVLKATGNTANRHQGLIFTDGTTTGSKAVTAAINDFNADAWIRTGTLAAHTGVPSGGGVANSRYLGLLYLRLAWTAANSWELAASATGLHWGTFSASYTMTPTHYGIFGSSWNTGVFRSGFEYFRVTT